MKKKEYKKLFWVFMIFIAFIIFQTIDGLRTGYIYGFKGIDVYKSQEPVGFYFVIAINVIFLLLFGGINVYIWLEKIRK